MGRRQYVSIIIIIFLIAVAYFYLYPSIKYTQREEEELTQEKKVIQRRLAVIDIRDLTFNVIEEYIRFDVTNLGNKSFGFTVNTYSRLHLHAPNPSRLLSFAPEWKFALPSMHFTVDPDASIKVEIKTEGISVPDIVWIEVVPDAPNQVVFIKTKDSTYSGVKALNPSGIVRYEYPNGYAEFGTDDPIGALYIVPPYYEGVPPVTPVAAVITIAWVDEEAPLRLITVGDFWSCDRVSPRWFVEDELVNINYQEVPAPLVFYRFSLGREGVSGSILILYYTGPLEADRDAFRRSAFAYLYDIGKSIIKSGGRASIPFTLGGLGYGVRWWKFEKKDIMGVAMFFEDLPIGKAQDSTTILDFTKLPFTTGILSDIKGSRGIFLLGGVYVHSKGDIYWRDFTGRIKSFPDSGSANRPEDFYFWRVYSPHMGYFTYRTTFRYLSEIGERIPSDIGGLPGLIAGVDFRYAMGELVVKWE